MKKLKVLVACEFSGTVRNAFTARGWDAWSCDLRESETPGNHITGDVIPLLNQHWDLLIAHPPCTYLTNAGAKHLYEEWTWQDQQEHFKATGQALYGHSPRRNEARWQAMQDSAEFFNLFLNTGLPHVAIENPVMVGHASKLVGGTATQFVQPYEFGHMESKRTGLRLIGLPPLTETHNVEIEMRKLPKKVWNRVHYMSPGPDREKERSRTAPGIAKAMANQWGSYLENLYL